MEIVIPPKLKNKLPDGSYVHTLCRNAEALFGLNPVYFSEYTEHGVAHVNAVLGFMAQLIPSRTLDKLNAQAVEALIASAVLHDIGMFIQNDGLHKLLFVDEYATQKTAHLDKQTWREAWIEYYTQARRWGDRKLIEVFGKTWAVEHGLQDKLPDEMKEWHKQLYGEFLRNHHHRLAHDIVTQGFFGSEQINLLENCACDEFTKDLIGLLARSHCMPVRDTLPYLKQKHGEKYYASPRSIPVLYLMVVLRIADYLHAGQQRAPRQRQQANRLRSQISQQEYAWNQAVYDELLFNVEKKEVYITAEPETPAVYQSLEKWIVDVQQELDLSWSIIAEHYAYEYELNIHRIDTNIFDENVLAGYNEKFLTRRAMLGANPDIVKRLVAPLYGDDPSYGVRELIQNAVDACNERTELDGTEGEITVNVDTEAGIFTITDNGIGMNEDVLLHYYLIAGSSYRYSPAWADKFHDEDNKPKIARNGRFGIGALATFLIGDTATVTTRHVDDDLGYQFTYELEPRVLDVQRVQCEPGTTIEIKIKDSAKEALYEYGIWTRWYLFSTPKITYVRDGVKQENICNTIFNLEKGKDSDDWFAFESDEYESFHWTLENYFGGDYLCNGIYIPDFLGLWYAKYSFKSAGYYHELPRIAVIDKKGVFPTDLARKRVDESLILNDDIVIELCKHRLAQMLKIKRNDKDCVFNNKGFIPKERSFMLNIARPVYLLGQAIDVYRLTILLNELNCCDDVAVGFFQANKKLYSKNMEDQVIGENLLSNQVISEIWANDPVIKIAAEYRSACQVHNIDAAGNWRANFPVPAALVGDNLVLAVKYTPTIDASENNLMLRVLEEYLPREAVVTSEGPFAGEVNGGNGGWIPYDMQQRKLTYPKAFRELARYMQ